MAFETLNKIKTTLIAIQFSVPAKKRFYAFKFKLWIDFSKQTERSGDVLQFSGILHSSLYPFKSTLLKLFFCLNFSLPAAVTVHIWVTKHSGNWCVYALCVPQTHECPPLSRPLAAWTSDSSPGEERPSARSAEFSKLNKNAELMEEYINISSGGAEEERKLNQVCSKNKLQQFLFLFLQLTSKTELNAAFTVIFRASLLDYYKRSAVRRFPQQKKTTSQTAFSIEFNFLVNLIFCGPRNRTNSHLLVCCGRKSPKLPERLLNRVSSTDSTWWLIDCIRLLKIRTLAENLILRVLFLCNLIRLVCVCDLSTDLCDLQKQTCVLY